MSDIDEVHLGQAVSIAASAMHAIDADDAQR
jgi:hypothetical protein